MRSLVRTSLLLAAAVTLFSVSAGFAQDAAPSSTVSVVPHIVKYSGTMPTAPAAASVVEAKFSMYAAQSGGDALWSETQQVALDPQSRYSVLLGATLPAGLPQNLFANGASRWLGVTLAGQEESPRTLLAAAPYSLKASDAETLGGHPASDFAMKNAKPDTAVDITTVNAGTGITVTGNGTATVTVGINSTYLDGLAANYAALAAANTFTASQTIDGNLAVSGTFKTPSGANKIAPGGAVDITYANGVYTINLDPAQGAAFGNGLWAQLAAANSFTGMQTLAPLGTATASSGFNSNAMRFAASAYNSTVSAPEAINYFWQAEPSGNNTSAPAGSLNLLYSTGANAGAETGLKIGAAGSITFASGQTFPGLPTLAGSNTFAGANTFSSAITFASSQTFPGTGTITGITTTSPLAGSGASGSVALSLNTTTLETTLNGVYPQLTAANTFAGTNTFSKAITFASGQTFPGTGTITGITTSSPLSGSGTSGSVALSLNTSALETTLNSIYPQLSANNSFTGTETISGASTTSQLAVTDTYTGNAILGMSTSGTGVSGMTSDAGNTGTAYGIYGGYNSGAQGAGVYGVSSESYSAYGVHGVGISESNSGVLLSADDGLGAGVWADASTGVTTALMATTDNGYAGIFYNDSDIFPTITVLNNNSGGSTGLDVPLITAAGKNGACGINSAGDVTCSGRIKTAVPTEDGAKQVEVYSVQSPENWFEDFGSAKLESGHATVAIDPQFAQIVNTGVEFHVFLTPQGECEGLYVAAKSAGGFEVRELHQGASNVAFDYRIVAKRKGHENERLADATAEMHGMTARRDQMAQGRLTAAAPGPERVQPANLPHKRPANPAH